MSRAANYQTVNDYRPEVGELLDALVAAGFELTAFDNGGGEWEKLPADRTAALEEVLGADDCRLLVKKQDGARRWLYLVYGNEPGYVVCDHYDDAALNAVVDAQADKWEGKPQPTMEVL